LSAHASGERISLCSLSSSQHQQQHVDEKTKTQQKRQSQQKNGKRNDDVDFQSENKQLGDPNKNYAIKGVQKLDFHPPKAV
jgi:hypothetical protein